MAEILGLDLSLTSTGWANELDFGVFRPQKEARDSARLVWLTNQIEEVRASRSIIVLEDYAFAASGRAITGLAELRGALLVRWWQSAPRPSVLKVAPTALRKFITGRGNAPKTDVPKEAFKRWGVEHKAHDAVEAYGLLRFGQAFMAMERGEKQDLTVSQREALDSFVKGLTVRMVLS